VLRALETLLRPGGRIAFTTIHIAPGLSDGERRRARAAGPRAVASRASYRILLERAGFIDIAEVDVTGEFIETARAWLDERDRHHDELAALEAPGAFDQRQADHRAQLVATEAGLLRRALLSAIVPA
jgi:hypothetical protein